MKIIKNIIALTGCSLLITFAVNAQKADSVWYNKKWKETNEVKERYYLRTITPVKGEVKSFEVVDYYPSGVIQMKGYNSSINPDIKHGEFLYYTEAGKLVLKNIWVNNIVAESFNYDSTGKQTQHVIKSEYLATLSAAEKFQKYGIKEIDKQPQYAKGEEAFTAFLNKNLAYPPEAIQDKIQGNVIIAATIDESGKLTEIRLLQKVHPVLDNEALRVAKLLPKKGWIPAQLKGKNITANIAFPVVFKL